jgi:predicted nucleic acid-binding protein
LGKEKGRIAQMKIIVDTNIVFSAVLNTNSQIARVILQPKTNLHFYSTDLLLTEIHEHWDKLIKCSKLTETELGESISLIKSKIRFINANLIPDIFLISAEELLVDIDIDDTEFVALTNFLHGKLWSGDKSLMTGLKQKGWVKFITTGALIELIELHDSK